MAKLSKNDFIAQLAPHVTRARQEGSPLFPSVRLAQNILETGGRINPHFNLGGFKATGSTNEWWKGRTYTTPTWEVINGKRIDTIATWRSYDSVYDFYRDQDRLFQSVRYARVRAAKTPEEQCKSLYLCGYATDAPIEIDGDPAYHEKLITVIKAYGLTKYDEGEPEMSKEDGFAIVLNLQKLWALEQDKAKREEIHRQANIVRKAAGIPLS